MAKNRLVDFQMAWKKLVKLLNEFQTTETSFTEYQIADCQLTDMLFGWA